MKKAIVFMAISLALLLSAVQTNAQNRLHSRLFYNSPALHNSPSAYSPDKRFNYSASVMDCNDQRANFLNEKVYKNVTSHEVQEIWSTPVSDAIRDKIVKDLKANQLFVKTNLEETGTISRIKIYPTIEIFYTDVRGFLFWGHSFAKARLKMAVQLDDKELLNDKYESLYVTKGNDEEWEGGKWETIEQGANITIGIALRQALDKFYADLENKLHR